MVIKPSKLKPLLRPTTLVFTTTKFPSDRLTEVCVFACTGCWLSGPAIEEATGATAVQPLNNAAATRIKSALYQF
jgi:hypothetical protein